MALTFSWGFLGSALALALRVGPDHDRGDGDDGEGEELGGLGERHGRKALRRALPAHCRILAASRRAVPSAARASVRWHRADLPRPRVRLQPLCASARPDAVSSLALGALARIADARRGLAAEPGRRGSRAA